jgi:hypothetical protein
LALAYRLARVVMFGFYYFLATPMIKNPIPDRMDAMSYDKTLPSSTIFNSPFNIRRQAMMNNEIFVVLFIDVNFNNNL